MKKTIFITLFLISFSSAIFANDGTIWKLALNDQSSICKSIIQPGGNRVGIVEDTTLRQEGKNLKGNAHWGTLKGKIRSGNKVGLNSIDYNFSGVIEGNKIRITKINPLDSNTYSLDKLKKFKKNNCKIIFTKTNSQISTKSDNSASDNSSYKQNTKTLMDKQWTIDMGYNSQWLKACQGQANKYPENETRKISQQFISDVSSLSKPDLKFIEQGVSEYTDAYGNTKYTCENKEIKKVIEDLEYYVSDLTKIKDKYYKSETSTEALKFCLQPNGTVSSTYSNNPDPCHVFTAGNDRAIEISAINYDLISRGKKTATEVRQEIAINKENERLAEIERLAEEKKEKELAEQKQFENQAQSKKELLEAQNYINDLLAYIKTYPSTFDILEITNFMIGNKNILDGSWGDLEKEGFKLFKNYTESSKEFLAFHEQQNDIREKDALNKITKAENNIKKLINFFTFYLQENVTSELAPDILDNIKLARNTLTSKDIGELVSIITKLKNYITSKNLSSNYRKFEATQTETVVTKKETKKEEKKINTTQISSKEDFKKAQSALKKLGFYNGVIDGLFGRVSIKALNAWQEVSNLTLTDSISVDLLEQLESAAKNSNNKVVKEESIVDTKTTQSTTYNPEQRAAQEYLNDFLIFIKSNPTLFDIIEITELISVNKVILDGEWNAIQEKDFAEFKSYTSASEDFLKFHSTQNDQRQKDILNEIAFQNTKLQNIISYFRYFLQNNITSDLAPEVIKNIKFAETSLEDQNLGILNDTNNQLEEFISNQNLNADYTKHIKSLASKDQEKDTIDSNSIDAIDLVNFDFIKEAEDTDFITLVNLSGQAPNALLNLEGKVVFEKDIAYSCFYQSKEIKNDLKYYLYDKVANQKFLAFDQGFECNQNNLLNYDLIFFEKDALLREEKSYVSTLAAAIGSDQLQLFSTITKKEYEKDFFQREMFAEQIKNDVLNEARLGFGALIIANDNTTLCTDVDSSLGHMSIMNLLGNEFIRMGYDKSVNDIAFNTTEDTFTNVQRGNCGFIYAGETSLNNLMTAIENSNTSYDVLPIWLSKKQVASEQERQENKEKGLLIDLQKKKEQIEKEKKLEQERLKADGILKAQEQQALRDRNRVVVEAHIELMENEIKLLFNKDTFKDTWLYESYPDLGKLMEKKFKEKWELDNSNVTINDYGLSDYKGRKIATFITDINFRLMNRDLGEYETMCMRLAIIADSEFSRWREPEAAVCKTNDDINLTEEELYEKYKNSFDIYKKRLNFQSAWIVE